MRTALRRTALCALAALAGCNFNRIDGAVEVDVQAVPAAAVRAEAVLTDANGGTIKREPHFGSGVYGAAPLVLTFPAIAAGKFTVQVLAYDSNSTEVGVGNGSGTYTAPTGPDEPLPTASVVLSADGLPGTFGTPCFVSGTGPSTCSGLATVCKHYTSTDTGICTSVCSSSAPCDMSPAGATCQPFLGNAGDTECQFECDLNGGTCPNGLVCGQPVAANGGKRYCQGSN